MTRSCAPTRSIVNEEGVKALVGFAHCSDPGRGVEGVGEAEGDGVGLAEGGGDGVGDVETETLGFGLSVGSAVCESRGHQSSAPTKSSSPMAVATATNIRFLVICTGCSVAETWARKTKPIQRRVPCDASCSTVSRTTRRCVLPHRVRIPALLRCVCILAGTVRRTRRGREMRR